MSKTFNFFLSWLKMLFFGGMATSISLNGLIALSSIRFMSYTGIKPNRKKLQNVICFEYSTEWMNEFFIIIIATRVFTRSNNLHYGEIHFFFKTWLVFLLLPCTRRLTHFFFFLFFESNTIQNYTFFF